MLNPPSIDRNTNPNCTLRSKTIRHNTFIDNGYGMKPNKFPASMQPDGNHVHKAHPLILPWYSSLHFAPSHSISITVILILSYHLYLGLTSNLFPWGFQIKSLVHICSVLPTSTCVYYKANFSYCLQKLISLRSILKLIPLQSPQSFLFWYSEILFTFIQQHVRL